jgi:AmmeMemoRadiSam system protein A
MATCSSEEKSLLLKTVRAVIASRLGIEKNLPDIAMDAHPYLNEKCGCFVSLHLNGRLRGCIGTIDPVTSLFEGVKCNAINAAFCDPRFPSLTAKEFPQVDIEISVLSRPKHLDFTNEEDLKKKLEPGVHGVILSQGRCAATFLPQVWQQLPDTGSFLSNLCLKAGLPSTAWKSPKTRIEVYTVEYFSESPSHL